MTTDEFVTDAPFLRSTSTVSRLLKVLLVVLAMVGLYTLGAFAVQARTDYQNFRKIVIWVAQKQVQEEQARQWQLQQQQQLVGQPAVPAPAPAQAPNPAPSEATAAK